MVGRESGSIGTARHHIENSARGSRVVDGCRGPHVSVSE